MLLHLKFRKKYKFGFLKLNKYQPCLWGFLPTSFKIIYFFGNAAFKANASKTAGIKPVVSNNLNSIPKSGM